MSEEQLPPEGGQQNRVYFFCGVAAAALAVVAFALSFVPPLGVYSLIASVLLELTALAFLSAQKKRKNFRAVAIVTIITYVLLAASMAVFIGGVVYSAAR